MATLRGGRGLGRGLGRQGGGGRQGAGVAKDGLTAVAVAPVTGVLPTSLRRSLSARQPRRKRKCENLLSILKSCRWVFTFWGTEW